MSEPVCLARKRRPWVSRDVTAFELLNQIGEGTYGEVWKAKDKVTNEEVALKKVRMGQEREGFPLTAIREIKLLKTLKHENIVNLKEIVMGRDEESRKGKDSIYMVFEYMDHDLTGLMDTPSVRFGENQVKCYMKQLLTGIHHCHSKDVLHRDIKGSNLLISNAGQLKIADFGLARFCNEQGRKYTNRVITLWYRPPELLLGDEEYGKSVDIWSCGCLLAELLSRKTLLPGRDEAHQIDLIFGLFGRPTDENWPNWRSLPLSSMVREDRYPPQSKFREYFQSRISPEALALLELLLRIDPAKRCTAQEALQQKWFTSEPLPCDPSDLPKYDSVHEFQAKQNREKAMAQARARRGDIGRVGERGENGQAAWRDQTLNGGARGGWHGHRDQPGGDGRAFRDNHDRRGYHGGPARDNRGYDRSRGPDRRNYTERDTGGRISGSERDNHGRGSDDRGYDKRNYDRGHGGRGRGGFDHNRRDR